MTEKGYVLLYFSKDVRFDGSGVIIRKPRIEAESFGAARRNVQAAVPVLRSVPKKLYRKKTGQRGPPESFALPAAHARKYVS